MRWSAKSEKNAVVAVEEPGPAAVLVDARAHVDARAVSRPRRRARGSCVPRPSGLRSSHQADPSSPNQGSEWRTPAAAVIAAERGDGQEPYGAAGIPHHRPVIRTAALLALWKSARQWTRSSPPHDLQRRYGEGDAAVDALDGVTVSFERGRFSAIMGPSGSGKSTLMHILAGLDRPDRPGSVADRRRGDHVARRRRPHEAAPRQARLHLPVLQPDPGAHGGGEHRPAALDRGPQARRGVARAADRDGRAR